MDQFLKDCPGCIGIANDITIHGCTEVEHDACLCNLMQVTCKYGVVFNPQKMHVKAPAINFLDCLYDANGVHLDLEKVDAVHALPAPTNVTELQGFLGMVTYLSPSVHGLYTLTAPLQELLKKDTLLQNNKPIAFASKALTNAEHRYMNIEREMLAIVFGAEQFHTYIYGRSFTIESDHKPLESISRKNLADMPAWLQCMMLCLQGYDLTIHYCPGKEMVIPDTLSRFSPSQALTFHWILLSIMPT